MPSVLVTGANRGLGLEFVRQYAADGWRVFATCREPAAAKALQAIAGQVSVHALDVADRANVEACANALAREPIDVLINNAGQIEPRGEGFGRINYERWRDILRINLFGPAWVTHAFVEHVAHSERRVVAMLTSGLASLTENRMDGHVTVGGLYLYRSSKAGLNMLVRKLAVDLKPRGITVLAVGPGHVQTDMGGPSAKLTPPESIAGLRRVLDAHGLADSGRFFTYAGEPHPW